MKDKLVSVIIPVYNGSKYIRKCLDSVLNQSYNNIEIICIDDGSKDNSLQILNQYKKKHPIVKVYSQENSGQSAARNFAIRQSTGEFLTFIDIDDYVSKVYIENLMNGIEKGTDIAISGRKIVGEKYSEPPMCDTNINIDILTPDEAIALVMYQKPDTEVWGKIFRSEYVKQISFPENTILEDLAIIYKLFSLAKTVSHVEAQDYYYVQHQKSTMNSDFNEKKLIIFSISEELEDFIVNKPQFLKDAVYSKMFASFSNLYSQVNDVKIKDDVWNKLVYYRRKKIFFTTRNKKVKVGVCCTYLGRLIYKHLLYMMKKVNK